MRGIYGEGPAQLAVAEFITKAEMRHAKRRKGQAAAAFVMNHSKTNALRLINSNINLSETSNELTRISHRRQIAEQTDVK